MEFIELKQQHLPMLEQWFQDPEVLTWLSGKLPLDRWFNHVQQSPDYWAWLIYEGSQPVGQLDAEIYPDGAAAVSLLTNPPLRQQGYGKRMMEHLLKRPEFSSVHTIQVGIEQANQASINCFRKAGFVEQGLDDDGLAVYIYPLRSGV